MEISTPAEFQKLEAGHYDGQYRMINVRGSAHPYLFTKILQFAETTTPTMRFTNEYGNYVQLSHTLDTYRSIEARFDNGNNPLADLPTNYQSYDIHFGTDAILTANDADVMTSWTKATYLRLFWGLSNRLNTEFAARFAQIRNVFGNRIIIDAPAVLC